MSSLIKRANGIFYVVSCEKSKRVWRSLFTTSRKQARRLFHEVEVKREMRSSGTVQHLWKALKPLLAVDLSIRTMELYEQTINRFIETISNKRLTEVDTYDVERFKMQRCQHIEKITLNKELRTLKAFFNHAVRLGHMKENPVSKCKLCRIDNKPPRALTLNEFEKLLGEMADDIPFTGLVTFAVSTAMRAGEIVHLEWSDVDLANRIIAVVNKPDHQVKCGKERAVPINDVVYGLLSRKELRSQDKVFHDGHMKAYTVKVVSDRFRKYRRRAGLDERLHFHSLRHTAITWMHEMGVPLAYIREIAGHSSILTTQLYAHSTPEHLKKAVNTIATKIGNAKPVSPQARVFPLSRMPEAPSIEHSIQI